MAEYQIESRRAISVKWRLIAAVLLVEIPLLALFVYSTRQATLKINHQLADVQDNGMKVFSSMLIGQMDNIHEFLFVNCWANSDFASIGEQATPDEAKEKMSPFVLEAELLISANKSLEAIVFYAPKSGCIVQARDGEPDEELSRLIQEIQQSQDNINTAWTLYRRDETSLLVRTCRAGDTYAMAVMNLSDLTASARVDYNLGFSIVFREGDAFLTEALWTRDYNKNMRVNESEDGSYYFVKNKNHTWLVTEQQFAMLYIVGASVYNYDWNWLYLCGILVVIVSVGAFLLAIGYLQVCFFRPLNALVDTICKIRSGAADLRAPETGGREFIAISGAFNGMLETLKTLRINAYESQLQARRAEMDALRLQIRRHFFLNCLKNIYALASSGEVEQVKQAALLLSTNLRYTLNFQKNTIDLATELRMCSDYMELQGIGQPQKPVLSLMIDAGLDDFELPPVSLLTALENCCKYGTCQDRPLKVRITAVLRRMDERDYVNLSVQDNGNGFPSDILWKLNNDPDALQQEGHVGFSNTLLRFRMLYGEECQALFVNCGGARVEWIVPLPERKTTDGEGNETTDRR